MWHFSNSPIWKGKSVPGLGGVGPCARIVAVRNMDCKTVNMELENRYWKGRDETCRVTSRTIVEAICLLVQDGKSYWAGRAALREQLQLWRPKVCHADGWHCVKTVKHFARIECWAGQSHQEMNSGERQTSLLWENKSCFLTFRRGWEFDKSFLFNFPSQN